MDTASHEEHAGLAPVVEVEVGGGGAVGGGAVRCGEVRCSGFDGAVVRWCGAVGAVGAGTRCSMQPPTRKQCLQRRNDHARYLAD